MTSELPGGWIDSQPGGDQVTDVMAELAAAEAAEAEARAEVVAAKARAERLRNPGTAEVIAEDFPENSPEYSPGAASRSGRPRWLRAVALAVGVLLTAGMLVLTGLMLSKHRRVVAHRAHDREVVEAASDAVVALLSIDHSRADADVKRVLDGSIGAFHDDFASRAGDFIKTAQDSNAVTKGSVTAAALESAGADTAVVLLAATSEVTNSNGARADPRPWRMSVTMSRDEDKWKMSNVEFVP
jgi:Mce-associated membrane protein